jgi:hypothetical protein
MGKRDRDGNLLVEERVESSSSDRRFLGTWGFPEEKLRKIHDTLDLSYPDDTVLALLELLKSGTTWDVLGIRHGLPRTTLHYRVKEFLFRRDWALDPMARFDAGNTSELEAVYAGPVAINGLVDIIPIYRCQSYERNDLRGGKRQQPCWKFEVWTTNSGIPFWSRGPFPGGLDDSEILKSRAPIVKHQHREYFLADKAYYFPRHMIVPPTGSAETPLTEMDKRFTLWHVKCRANVKHFFARLRRFEFLNQAKRFDVKFIARAFRFLLWCFHVMEDVDEFSLNHRAAPLTQNCGCGFVL